MGRTLRKFLLFRGLGLTWLYVPFQWFYLRDQGLSATELMVLNTIFCVTAVATEVPTGAIADRFGRKRVLVFGAFASTFSCLTFVLAKESFLGLAFANVMAALAMTCISGADSAYLFDLCAGQLPASKHKELYQRAESLSSTVRLGAAAAGGLLAFALVSSGFALSLLYLATAVLTGIAAVIAMGLEEPAPKGQGHKGGASFEAATRDIWFHGRQAFAVAMRRHGLIWLFCVSALLFPVVRVGLFFDQPFLRHVGFATAAVGLAFAAKDLVASLTAAATARLLKALGQRRLLLVLACVAAACVMAMALATGPWAALLVFGPAAVFGVYSPLIRVFINGMVPESTHRATVLSIEGMARRVGFALFSPLAGVVFDLWSLKAAFWVTSAWAGAAAVLALIMVLTTPKNGTKRPLPLCAPNLTPPPPQAHPLSSPSNASLLPPSLVGSGQAETSLIPRDS